MKAPPLEIDLRIAEPGWRSVGDDTPGVVDRALQAAANRVDIGAAALDVLLTNDAEMRQLNASWRGKDKPTDVLSFRAAPQTLGPAPCVLGNVALGWETCRADAAELSRGLDQHLSHLLVHGFLHLMGYDHERADEAATMEAMEVTILGDLGYPDPYEASQPERDPTPAR